MEREAQSQCTQAGDPQEVRGIGNDVELILQQSNLTGFDTRTEWIPLAGLAA